RNADRLAGPPTRSRDLTARPSARSDAGQAAGLFRRNGTRREDARVTPPAGSRLNAVTFAERFAFLSNAAWAEGSLSRTTTYGALRRCGVKPAASARVSPVFAPLRVAGRPARSARPP